MDSEALRHDEFFAAALTVLSLAPGDFGTRWRWRTAVDTEAPAEARAVGSIVAYLRGD